MGPEKRMEYSPSKAQARKPAEKINGILVRVYLKFTIERINQMIRTLSLGCGPLPGCQWQIKVYRDSLHSRKLTWNPKIDGL